MTARPLIAAAAAAFLLVGCGRPAQTGQDRSTEAVPVKVHVVAPEDVTATVTATGTLRAVDDVPVTAEVGGRVTDVLVRVGERVERDSVLVRLDDELARLSCRQAKAQAEMAQTDLADAEAAFERARSLYESEDIPQAEFEAAERRLDAARAAYDGALAALGAAERRLRDTGVRSPVAGWVAFVYAEVGHVVAAGTPVAHVVNDATMRVDLGLSERQIEGVRARRRAEVRVRTVSDRSFPGTVEYVGRRADDATKTYPVRVVVPNGDRILRSGMVADVSVTAADYGDAIVVERDWVTERFGEPAVYVAADSVATLKRVTLGRAVGDRVVVTSGLSPGDLLITDGLDRLSESARIEVGGESRDRGDGGEGR